MLHHMRRAETEVLRRRVRLMLDRDDPRFPGAVANPPEQTAAGEEVAIWQQARAENLDMLRGLTPEQLDRRGRHDRWGPINVREQVTGWAYHDLDHLRQLAEMIQGELHGGIGGYQGLYPRPGLPATA
jgi:hypothetical protein